MRHKLIAASLALAIVGSGAQASTMVRDVEVMVDLDAISNPKAAAYWSRVSADLEGAIVRRLIGRTADDGASIKVDLDEVSLANTFELATNIADSRISGAVSITSLNDNTVFDGYDLTVTHAQSLPFFVEGTDLVKVTTDSAENYAALVEAFASHIVENLK